ncbi:glycoside hydrolase [Streptomyces sp. NBC_01558]|uniref:sialidase family protein n=1 Tax=Streptomyces sp. NBC_01558 TaxID=2975878 RepID=UPI002DD9113E|nr:sialidase family protein [Streptomyces sp. NBC_01558]WSD79799.1 glycoside hydrolase [Streptomyces sp. NBC_01558]
MTVTTRMAAFASAAGLLTALAATGGTASAAPLHGRQCTSSVPYTAGRDGYDTYRIPATVTTRAGTLLAFAEGRHSGAGDTGDIDVVLRRSPDGGCTWGPLQVVTSGDGDTRGNPAPVVDPRSGRVVLLTSYNSGAVSEAQIMRGEVTAEQSRRVFVQSSRDDGRHFTAPRDVTAATKLPGWRWYATGPGHAIALRHGPHAGRLVVPANHSAAPPAGSADAGQEARYYGAHALYSDDGGLTWHLGFVDDTYDGKDNANENAVAELPDGRLYFSARDQNGTSPGNRLDTYSGDGGETLDRPYAVQPTLNDVPVVQGSVLQLTGGPAAPLLFAGPSVPTARRSMALWRSTTAGAGFTRTATLSADPAAYSDLVQLGPSRVGILYETGVSGPYETITFRRLPVNGPTG